MNLYEEQINKLREEINKINFVRNKRTKNLNTILWLLLILIDILLYIKIKDISLFTKYQNTLLEILKYLITGCSCLIVDTTLYTIGDVYNFKLYEKDEIKIKNIEKEIKNIIYYKNKISENKIKFDKTYNINNSFENKLYRVRKKD